MTYKPRRERRAQGGKAADTEPLHPEHGHQYNAQGSPEEKSESAKSDGFKRGGAMKKRKRGGHVEGEAARRHLGKRARGGATAPHVEMHMGEHHEHHGSGHHHAGGHHGGETKHHHHEGHEEKPHRARGGHVPHKRARGGGAPFSAAHHISPPGNDRKSGPGEDAESIP